MKTHPLVTLIHALVPILLFSASVSWGQQQNGIGYMAINAKAAQQITRGEGVRIGILDTGIQKNHPDVKANIIGGINLVKKAGNSSKWDDDHGHGTHIAGIIAAADNTIGVIGVAPSAKLFVVKVLPKDYISNPSQIDPRVIADGIYACMTNGVHIINIGFEIAVDSPVLHDAIIAASNAGIILVAGVGDRNFPIVLYPAKYPEVIAVSGLRQDGYNQYSLAAFSNWGPGVDFTALGVSYSTWIGSTYRLEKGTGQAAAYVSGVAALMLSAGKTDLVARDVPPVALPPEQQGLGLIDAYLTVTAEEIPE